METWSSKESNKAQVLRMLHLLKILFSFFPNSPNNSQWHKDKITITSSSCHKKGKGKATPRAWIYKFPAKPTWRRKTQKSHSTTIWQTDKTRRDALAPQLPPTKNATLGPNHLRCEPTNAIQHVNHNMENLPHKKLSYPFNMIQLTTSF